MSRSAVKNRAPAPIQITAEQLLREAQDRGIEDAPKEPKQFATDREELQLYQQTKRKDFEDQLRRQRQSIGVWCRYALWEASQLEFARARSVFERALDVDYRSQTIWLKYAEMEMKNKFINHARNVWDRAVTLLPRVDNFWYKYTYMEEMVGAIENARQVFERWMAWEPDDMAWGAFIKFEMRQGLIDAARALYERYIALWPTSRAYLKYAKWEEANQQKGLSRKIYERSLAELHPQEKTEKLLLNFARFEERCKEVERARVIYKFAVQHLATNFGGDAAEELQREYVVFEKRHGARSDIDDVVVTQRRQQFEEALARDITNYDIWFDYIRLEESEGRLDNARAVYTRAVSARPPVLEKRYWKRYIYLWINFAVFEELTTNDISATRKVYQDALAVVPHETFTFGKLWLMAAQFEIRQHELTAARKLLGQAIGRCGKKNIFEGYIDLELQLGEIDRCRQLYSKYLATLPHVSSTWIKFAQLEASVGEVSRARSIFELGIDQELLDQPELLWKSLIEFEVQQKESENARLLYERLLERSSHLKVWISYAKFEYEVAEWEEDRTRLLACVAKARVIFKRGLDALRAAQMKDERVLLLETWREMEQDAQRRSLATAADISAVEALFPRKVHRSFPGNEEVVDYIFPDDEQKPAGLKLLEKALAWKSGAAKEPVLSNNSDEDNFSRKRKVDALDE